MEYRRSLKVMPALVFYVVLVCTQFVCEGATLGDGGKELTWTRKAAEAAEAAASHHCSGHGYVFIDTFVHFNGKIICECNECFTGPDCSKFIQDCPANVNSGDNVMMEPFWIENAEASTVVIPGWYRMSYNIMDYAGSRWMLSLGLEKQIRALHELVGNAVTEGRFIVPGTGSTQLMNAAVNSLSITAMDEPPAIVVAKAPYYNDYAAQTLKFRSTEFVWKGDAVAFQAKQNHSGLNATTKIIEFVTSPNNPDGTMRKPVFRGNNAEAIADRAYYWPHFTGIGRPADEDIMLFTLSKVTGHCGSRFGWAIVKDYRVYKRMQDYINENTLGVSHDTQLRATQLIKTMLEGYSPAKQINNNNNNRIFHYSYPIMRDRWLRLQKIFNMSNRFSLQTLEPRYCNFFKTVTGPSPAYAWVKCKRKEDGDCTKVFKDGGIIGRRGSLLGADEQYIRLSLIKRNDTFDNLERRLLPLVLA